MQRQRYYNCINGQSRGEITTNACKAVLSLNQYISKAIENDLNNIKTGTGNFQIFDYVKEKNIKSGTLYINKKETNSLYFKVNLKEYRTSGNIVTFETEKKEKTGTGNIKQIYHQDQKKIIHNMIINKISFEKSEYNRKSYIILQTNTNNNHKYTYDFEIRDGTLSGAAFKNNQIIGIITTKENTVTIRDNFNKLISFF